jgi:hypothetical protein
MKHTDIAALMRAAAPVFRDFVVEALRPVVERLADLEAQLSEREAGLAETRAGIEKEIGDRVSAAIAGIPKPKDGASISVDDVTPMIRAAVADAIKAVPAAKDGIGLAGAMIDRDGILIVTLTDGSQKSLGPVVGKGIDPAAVSLMVDESVSVAVKEIPVPKDGKDVDEADLDRRIADGVAHAVSALTRSQEFNSAGLADVERLVSEAAKSIPVVSVEDLGPVVDKAVGDAIADLPKPKDGDDGKSVTVDELRPMVTEIVARSVADLPEPKPGKDADETAIVESVIARIPKPQDGKSVTIDDVRPLIAEAVEAIPKPQDGKSIPRDVVVSMVAEEVARAAVGISGEPDRAMLERIVLAEVEKRVAALPVPKDGVTLEEVRPALEEMVEKRVAALPMPKDGESIDPEVVKALVVETVRTTLDTWERPKDADPVEVAKLLIPEVERAVANLPRLTGTVVDREGNLIASYSDGRKDNLGNVLGRDGSGFDSIEPIEDDLTYGVRFGRGNDAKEMVWAKPTLADIDKGIWKPGAYRRGAGVTCKGSFWICRKDTEQKPADGGDWRLAVRAGRDGKDVRSPLAGG